MLILVKPLCTLPNITSRWFFFFPIFFLMILDEYLVGTCWVFKKKIEEKRWGITENGMLSVTFDEGHSGFLKCPTVIFCFII